MMKKILIALACMANVAFFSCSRTNKNADALFNEAILSADDSLKRELFVKISAGFPETDKGLFCRAVLMDTTDYQQQLKLLDEAIGINPGFAEAYNYRGIIYSSYDSTQRAIADFTKAIKLRDQYADAYFNRGNMKRRAFMFEEALLDYDTAITINPRFTDAFLNRGTTYDNTRRYAEALKDFNAALQLDSSRADLYLARGIVYGELNQFDLSISDFDRALVLKPGYVKAYSNRGVSRFMKGDKEGACSDWCEARKMGDAAANNHYNAKCLQSSIRDCEPVK